LPKTVPHFEIPGRRLEWLASTPSTMLVAAQLAREGCAAGTIVVADEQTAGIGRHGRRWHSEPGAGLYTSLVLRPDLSAAQLPVIMLALGLAAREAIMRTAGLATDLRWPNDVLIGGKKCAGILAQLEGGAVIAGIGINVSQRVFPEGFDTPPTSLALEGANVSREALLIVLAECADQFCSIAASRGAGAIIRLFTAASSYARGRRVRADAQGRWIEGIAQGLDRSGFLRIREDNGTIVTILAGGVRPA
jgi:BirA family biotin operon repressor/biotin-[acetyl-CoA-carboxylase] ligase